MPFPIATWSANQIAQLPVLFAALDDWIGIILFLFFVLGPILNAIGGGGKAKGRPNKAPPRIPPVHPGQGRPQMPPQQQPQPGQGGRAVAPQPQAGRGRQALENEIEEFLRRAGKGARKAQPKPRRQQQPARPQQQQVRQQAPPKQHVSLEQRRLNKEAKERRDTKQQQANKVAKAKQKRQRQRERMGDGVGRHVREHIESRPVGEHSNELGKHVGLADERVEQHLHDVFDHQLGGLSKDQVFQESQGTDAAVWTKKETISPATKIRAMLRDPDSVRNAIILTEIFNRPSSME